VTSRHLVVVSYFHPPYPSSGGNRWDAMAHYLRSAGHRVTIVASDAFGSLDDDETNCVIRARDLKAARLLRVALRRGAMPQPGMGAATEPPPSRLLRNVVVPDAHLAGWVPAAVSAVRRLVARDDVDCMVTTSPPDSVHLTGLAVGSRRPAWLADFRDGWLFEPLREPFPTALQRRLDAAFEGRVVRRADAVVGATRAIAEDFRRRYGVDAMTVTNGYDPRLDEAARDQLLPRLPDERRLLVHTGALSGPRGRDARPLLEALLRLMDEPVGSKLVLVQAGPTRAADEPLLATLREHGIAVTLGIVSRPFAIALQRRAAVLLLLTSADVSQATGKLYEYLAARRPILALAAENEAARIVRETNAGVVVAPGDVDAIARVLRSAATGELELSHSLHGTEQYVYPGPADAMTVSVERAIRHRRTAPRRAST
jgi:glycosyltransferase involved in cell wall biosynthesis